MTTFLTAAEYEELRSGIARTNAEAREVIEKQYVEDKLALTEQYQKDISANQQDLREAYVAAGLNPDGSDPQGRPQGSAV